MKTPLALQTTRPRLNYDVVNHVMSMFRGPEERASLLRLMETCRTVRTLGVRHLLLPGVRISPSFNQESFHAFMFASPFTRFSCLRRLFIDPPHDCELLVEVLQRSHMLENLHIDNCHQFISGHLGLSSGISLMENLRSLRIHDADQRTCDLLSKLGPRLEFISLHGHRRWPAQDNPPLDTSHLLSSAAAGLESLDLSYSYLPEPNLHFPKVTWLRVEVPQPTNLANFLSGFPVLERLHISWIGPNRLGRGFSGKLREIREVSEPWASDRSWPSIRELNCDVPCLYGMAISCRVDYLNVDEVFRQELPLMPAVLSQTRPTCLDFSVCSSEFDMDKLPELLRQAPSTLTRLEASFTIDDQTAKAREMSVSPPNHSIYS